MQNEMKKRDHEIISKEMDEIHKLLLRHAKKWNIHFETIYPQENTEVIINEIGKNIEQDIENDLDKLEDQIDKEVDSGEGLSESGEAKATNSNHIDSGDNDAMEVVDEEQVHVGRKEHGKKKNKENHDEEGEDNLGKSGKNTLDEEELFEEIEAALEGDDKETHSEVLTKLH